MPTDPVGPITGAGAGPSAGTIRLRPATPEDAHPVAELYSRTRASAVPAIPPAVHTPAEDRAFFAGLLSGPAEVWVAEREEGGPLDAFLVLEDDWVHSLYVRPGRTGAGIGAALLDVAKARRPDGFSLWVFETNTAARRFYERHGLVACRRTDGMGNEERAPDLMMVWPGADPVARLRRAVDDLDEELARLLELRSGLTAAIVAAKPGDARVRDTAREAEIVARMAPLAPRLGSARLARIVHAIIGESIDAAVGGA